MRTLVSYISPFKKIHFHFTDMLDSASNFGWGFEKSYIIVWCYLVISYRAEWSFWVLPRESWVICRHWPSSSSVRVKGWRVHGPMRSSVVNETLSVGNSGELRSKSLLLPRAVELIQHKKLHQATLPWNITWILQWVLLVFLCFFSYSRTVQKSHSFHSQW